MPKNGGSASQKKTTVASKTCGNITMAFCLVLVSYSCVVMMEESFEKRDVVEVVRIHHHPHVMVFVRQSDTGIRQLQSYVLQTSNPAFPRMYERRHMTADEVDDMTVDMEHCTKVVRLMESMDWVPIARHDRDTIIFMFVGVYSPWRNANIADEVWNDVTRALKHPSVDHMVPLGKWRTMISNTRDTAQARFKKTHANLDGVQYATPFTLRRFHGFADSTDGHGVRVGPMEFQDFGAHPVSDERAFCAATRTNCLTNVGAHGPYDPAPGVAESALDFQTVSGMLPNATLQYWTTEEWVVDGMAMMFRSKERPDVITLSHGWCELRQCPDIVKACSSNADYVRRGNNNILKLTALGTSVLVSDRDAGDTGRGFGDCSGRCATWPASSPWVTAVGALPPTAFTHGVDSAACGDDTTCIESVRTAGGVEFSHDGWTSGGGVSCINPAFDFQQSYSAQYLVSNNSIRGLNCTGRPFCDVTTLGTNFLAVTSGNVQPAIGTSANAPAIAAALAGVIGEMRRAGHPRKSIGFANQLFNMASINNPQAFHKPSSHASIVCTEGLCCVDGFQSDNSSLWDPVYGFGVPQVMALVKTTLSMSCA